MEENVNKDNIKNRRSPNIIRESLLNKIRDNPNGLRFLVLQNTLKLSPSVLSRNLKIMERELKVIKESNLYRPSGADISQSFLDRVIKEVDHYLLNRWRKLAKKDDEEKVLKIALSEILPVAGRPESYVYEKIIDDKQLISLLDLLQQFANDGSGLINEFMEPLAQFIERYVRIQVSDGESRLNRELQRLLESIEEDIFRSTGAGESRIELLKKSAWLPIYRSLIASKSNKIMKVFARLILPGKCEQTPNESDLYLEPQKMDTQHLSSLKGLIYNMTSYNDLPNDYPVEVLHLMAPKIFNCELEYAGKSEHYALFLHDLRKTIELHYNDKPQEKQ